MWGRSQRFLVPWFSLQCQAGLMGSFLIDGSITGPLILPIHPRGLLDT